MLTCAKTTLLFLCFLLQLETDFALLSEHFETFMGMAAREAYLEAIDQTGGAEVGGSL